LPARPWPASLFQFFFFHGLFFPPALFFNQQCEKTTAPSPFYDPFSSPKPRVSPHHPFPWMLMDFLLLLPHRPTPPPPPPSLNFPLSDFGLFLHSLFWGTDYCFSRFPRVKGFFLFFTPLFPRSVPPFIPHLESFHNTPCGSPVRLEVMNFNFPPPLYVFFESVQPPPQGPPLTP